MPTFDTPITTNDQSLDRVLANPLPVLLILNADKNDAGLASILSETARAEAGKLLVARLSPAENPVAARRFKADVGTTLIGWKGGAEAVHMTNPAPEEVKQTANYLLGQGAKPVEQKTTTSANGAAHPVTVSESTFEQQVLQSDVPVLVDFWAAWCGPCRMVAPTLDKLAGDYQGRIKIAKLNVDENPHLAMRYGAQSIPLLVMFKNGKPFQQLLGAHPEPNIRTLIERAIH